MKNRFGFLGFGFQEKNTSIYFLFLTLYNLCFFTELVYRYYLYEVKTYKCFPHFPRAEVVEGWQPCVFAEPERIRQDSRMMSNILLR